MALVTAMVGFSRRYSISDSKLQSQAVSEQRRRYEKSRTFTPYALDMLDRRTGRVERLCELLRGQVTKALAPFGLDAAHFVHRVGHRRGSGKGKQHLQI